MASYAVAAAEQGAYDKTLVASTVDTVTFANNAGEIEVYSDGVAALYFRLDGTGPSVGDAAAYYLPAGVKSSRRVRVPAAGATVVKLISSGTPLYSVYRAV